MVSLDKDFGLMAVETHFPEAYEALPELYKDDSCLRFFLDVNGNLCAQNENDEEFLFDEVAAEWIDIGSSYEEEDLQELDFDVF